VKGDARDASRFLAVASSTLLEARSWDAALWVVQDEGPVDRAILLIERRDGVILLVGD
jgi:hypothetical protein